MSKEYPYLKDPTVTGGSGITLPPITPPDGGGSEFISFDPTVTPVIYITACGAGGGGGSGCGPSLYSTSRWSGFAGGGGGAALSIYQWPLFVTQFPLNDGDKVKFEIIVSLGGAGGASRTFSYPSSSSYAHGDDGDDGTPTQILYNGIVIITLAAGNGGGAGEGDFYSALSSGDDNPNGGYGGNGGDSERISTNIIAGTDGGNTNGRVAKYGAPDKYRDSPGTLYPGCLLRDFIYDAYDNKITTAPGGYGGTSFFGNGPPQATGQGIEPMDAFIYGSGGGGSDYVDVGSGDPAQDSAKGGKGGDGVVIISH
jgi:hypothetical protein